MRLSSADNADFGGCPTRPGFDAEFPGKAALGVLEGNLKLALQELIPHTMFFKARTKFFISNRQSERYQMKLCSRFEPLTLSLPLWLFNCLLSSFGMNFFKLLNLFTSASNIRTSNALPNL
jgi:hypothetical protein